MRAVLFGVSGAGEDGPGDEDEADGPTVADMLGEMTAEDLAEQFGLARMMGSDPDRPWEPESNVGEPGEYPPQIPAYRQPIGATFDGEGLTIIYMDGGVARFRKGHGWKKGEPVPETLAAARAAQKAETAAAAAALAEE